MDRLGALSDEKMRKHHVKWGAGENLFGVKMGDVRALAKEIGKDPKLAAALWESGNMDAMTLATFLMKPKELSGEDLDRLVGSTTYYQVADSLGTNVVKPHSDKEAHRDKWMDSDHDMTARMGWSLTTERVVKSPDGLDLSGLLDRIEREMGSAIKANQWAMNSRAWTMNYCLAEIGINFPEHRDRALAIGEKVGAFRDYPVSKGCTSPFAPIWISAMVARKG
jgi:3-methyladenine DNA glycosylase AlkD